MLSLLSMVNPAGSSVPLVPATVSGSVVFFFGLLFVRPPPITSYNMPFGISSSSNTNNSSLDDNGISRHRHHRHSRATVATATLARPSDTKMSLGPSSLSSSRKHSLKRQRLPNTSSRGYVYGTSEQVPVAPHCSVTSAEVEEGDSGGGGGGVGASGGGLTLERVKNIRDLGSVEGSGIVKGRVYRTGFLSEATKADADRLMDVTGLKTLVDLRSATELEKDQFIHAEVYRGFENVGNKDSDSNTSKRRAASRYTKDTLQGMWETQPAWSKAMFDEVAEAFSNGDAGDAEPLDGEDGNAEEEGGTSRRRYFVSLIDEGIYKKGVFQRLRGRHKAAVMALAPATIVSRRCTKKARGIFLREINDGGLILLNELLLQYSGEGINRVLRLLATRERHPVALYCTAGKDRTGLVMALALAALGVPDEAIVDDYARSDAAYRELGDRDAMVGALAQEDLDPDTFLCAPRHVMEDTLRFVRQRYGSVDEYLESIGFDTEWRERLRDSLLVE